MRVFWVAAFLVAIIPMYDRAIAQPIAPGSVVLAQDDQQGQDAAPPEEVVPPQPPEEASPPSKLAKPVAKGPGRRTACHQEARDKGLRGHALADQVAICLATARLDCTKQAVAQGLAKRERVAFVRDCLGPPLRKRQQ